MTQPLHIGVLSQVDQRRRTLAIARGERKVKRHEPKVWVSSFEALSRALTNENLALIKQIAESRPHSVADLARLADQSLGKTSRAVRMLAQFGFVALKKRGRCLMPVATAREIRIWIPLDADA